MKSSLRDLDVVCVSSLAGGARAFEGTEGAMRAPALGDVGTVVHAEPGSCFVEAVDQHGATVWLAEFREDELERVLPGGSPLSNRHVPTVFLVHRWIEEAWRKEGKEHVDVLPVWQATKLGPDEPASAVHATGVAGWTLDSGKMHAARVPRPSRVPYVVFSADEGTRTAVVHVQWAGRCGYGFSLQFSDDGELIDQSMRWIS